ncbi:MAG TPA: pitrilysin family protein [Alphaproteobacteria bacterium]|nr:pitrilysin family protein [Alphaproteobacteria bacterium]HNS43812.1 pitrilysin family protein [Alphaproteobacteria bacterium]
MKKLLTLCLVLFCGIQTAHASILDIQDFTTEKGIRIWLVEDHTVPVLSLQFLFRGAGSINDPEDKQGLSQILSNTLDEGAGDLDAKTFQAQLTDQSISLRFFSSRDDFGGALKTLSKYQDHAFKLLHLALTAPRFEEDAIRRMRDANFARIRSSMTDPEWMTARLTNAVLFRDHPYAMNSGGTLSTLPRITADDLQDKVKTQLGRDRLIIAVAGNIAKGELSQKIDDVFGNLPDHSKVGEVSPAKFPAEEKPVQFEKDIPQTVIQIAMPGIPNSDPDYFAAEILNYTLGGAGFGSRLTEVVREQRGLTYGIYSNLSEMDYANLLTIGTSTRTENVGEVLSLVNQELSRMGSEPVSAKELADAKSYLVGSVPLDLTSTDRIAAMMISFQSFNLPTDYLDIREKGLKSATREDVLRVAKRLLGQNRKVTVMVGTVTDPSSVRLVEKLPDIE